MVRFRLEYHVNRMIYRPIGWFTLKSSIGLTFSFYSVFVSRLINIASFFYRVIESFNLVFQSFLSNFDNPVVSDILFTVLDWLLAVALITYRVGNPEIANHFTKKNRVRVDHWINKHFIFKKGHRSSWERIWS